MSRRKASTPGVVEVRLLGERPECDAWAAAIASHGEILTAHGPYENRREPGVRLYLTVRARKGAEAGREPLCPAAGNGWPRPAREAT